VISIDLTGKKVNYDTEYAVTLRAPADVAGGTIVVERSAKAEIGANTMGPARHNAGGSSRIAYSFGFFELEPDQALLLEASAPDARFWDVQLYTMGWFEPFDYANHITSLNHTQSRLSADGCFRAVVAHDDPQVPNWLDTEGRREGMITHRWIDTRSEPTITSRLVGLDELPLRDRTGFAENDHGRGGDEPSAERTGRSGRDRVGNRAIHVKSPIDIHRGKDARQRGCGGTHAGCKAQRGGGTGSEHVPNHSCRKPRLLNYLRQDTEGLDHSMGAGR